MKITPLILFFILLVVLVLSIVFSRYLPLKNTQEGLIGFNTTNHKDDVNLLQYDGDVSRKVTQVHDSIYFDQKNGNLIEVFVKDSGSGNSTVSSITVTDRNQNQKSYSQNASGSTDSSKISSVSSAFNRFFYTSPVTISGSSNPNSDKYKILYISYNTDTILYIFQDIGTSPNHKYKLIKSALFNSGSSKTITDWSTIIPDTDSRISGYDNIDLLNPPAQDSSTENLIGPATTKEGSIIYLYQFNKTSLFDLKTGDTYLITYSSDGSTGKVDKIFDRTGKSLDIDTYKITSSLKSATSPWAIKDSVGNFILVYPYSTKTVVTILAGSDANGSISVRNVVYFKNQNTVDGLIPFNATSSSGSGSGSSSSGSGSSSSGSGSSSSGSGSSTSDTDRMNQLYDLWLYYFDSLASSGTSNDYILKTQIVPPVCPQCPDCNCGDGVCTTCGGNGGSGTRINNDRTRGATGQSNNSTTDKILNDNKNNQDTRFNNPNIGGTISNVSGDVTGLVGSTVGTAGGLVGSTIGTAGGIVNNAVNTAGGLLYSAGSGAVNLLKPGQSQTGPVGINYQTQQPGVQQRDQYYSQGQINTPVDNYSQYGALPSRGGNYMPMTADFSQFGK